MDYSFVTGLKKAVINLAIWAIPVALLSLPQEWQELTVGGALVLLANYVKMRLK